MEPPAEGGPPPAPAAGPASPRPSSEGRGRDLAFPALFVLFLAALAIGGYLWLRTWKHSVDAMPVLRYEQPAWSDLGGTLAYLQVEIDPGPEGRVRRRQLWSVSRFGDQHRLLADLPPEPVRLVGWLGGEQRVLLQVETPPGEPPVLLDIAGDGSGGRRVRFPLADLRLVGRGGDELYFERPRRSGGKALGGAELLSWKPDGDGLTSLVTIPSPSSEPIRLESVTAAPDGRRLAIVLRAPAADGPLGLWVHHRDRGDLVWMTIAVEGARSMAVDWSPNSGSLVGAAWLGDASELYLVDDAPDPSPTRLRTASGRLPFVPVWPRDGNRVLLLEGERVLEYDFRQRRADVVLDPQALGLPPLGLVLSPMGSLAAFHVKEGDTEDLYVVALRGGRPDPVGQPGARRQARGTLLYEIASGVEFALSRWAGGNPGPAAATVPPGGTSPGGAP